MSLHQTLTRPPTEPYEIWKERRRIQNKELRQYLKGRLIWCSAMMYNKRTELKPEWKKIKVQGTYKKP